MLDTERLHLRRFQASDVGPYAALCADPEVMRWIGDGKPRKPEESQSELGGFERAWDERGFGLFAATRRDTQDFLGFVGLSIPSFLPEILPVVEVGWRLSRGQWGMGYATEAAAAVLEFGFATAKLERIVSVHRVGNDASQRVMEKVGMKLERETVHPRLGFALRVHEIRAAQGLLHND